MGPFAANPSLQLFSFSNAPIKHLTNMRLNHDFIIVCDILKAPSPKSKHHQEKQSSVEHPPYIGLLEILKPPIFKGERRKLCTTPC